MSDLTFVHRFVPATTDGSPTLLMLHGTGGNQDDLIPLGEAIAPGAAMLSPLGKTTENGMPRFFRRLSEGVFDLEDLRFRTDELAEFLQAVRKKYEINAPLVAVGYSNGANIAANVMFRHPGLLTGAVLMRGMVPFPPEQPVDLTGTPVLICAGRRDPIAFPTHTEELRARFESLGADVSLHWHEGGHELGQGDVHAAQRWLEVNWPA